MHIIVFFVLVKETNKEYEKVYQNKVEIHIVRRGLRTEENYKMCHDLRHRKWVIVVITDMRQKHFSILPRTENELVDNYW